MALTRNFRETIRDRAQREPAFRRALLQEAVEQMLGGDVDTGKSMIRNYINATVGFPALAMTVDTPGRKPDAHVRTEGQPFSQKPVRRNCSPAGARRRAFRGEGHDGLIIERYCRAAASRP
jgi:hypothetical protein